MLLIGGTRRDSFMYKECVRILNYQTILDVYHEEAISRQHAAKWCRWSIGQSGS